MAKDILDKCARDSCNEKFKKSTHNQKYCSDECCRIATNEKLKDAYYEKKARLAGKKRICKSKNCGAILSMYNEGKICDKCVSDEKENERQILLGILKNVSR
jgi:hypothetical protein